MGQGLEVFVQIRARGVSYKAVVIVYIIDDGGFKLEEWQWKWKDWCKIKRYFRVTSYHRLATNKYVLFGSFID